MTHDDHRNHGKGTTAAPPIANSAFTDPVCGMAVDPATAAGAHAHAGTTYYFCSRHCL